MKLALECPASLLEQVQPLADFDFILAHLVLSDSAYADFYRGSTRTKILDNSVNELLEPLSLDQLKRAAEVVHPDLVVAPDYLGDSEKTISALDRAINVFGKGKVLPVVQGSTLREALDCSDYLHSELFTSVAVPYDITSRRTDSLEVLAAGRQAVVMGLESSFSTIHLLGLTCLEELEAYRSSRKVVSIDTGSPVLHGLRGLRFGRDRMLAKAIPTLEQMGSPAGFEVDQGDVDFESIYYNIAYLRGLLR